MFTSKKYSLLLFIAFQHAYDSCGAAFVANSNCVELKESGELAYFLKSGAGCWQILNPTKKMVVLNILSLALYSYKPCQYNYLTIEREGDAEVTTLCAGSKMPINITSQSSVEVKFRSEWTVSDSGFRMIYAIRDFRCSDENAFRCTNLTCIPNNKVCDGVNDCINGIDERKCSNNQDGNDTPSSKGHPIVLSNKEDEDKPKSKARPIVLRDCIEFFQQEDNDEMDKYQQEIINGTAGSSNTSQILKAFHMQKLQSASKTAKAADAVFAAKEAVKKYYENEEQRAKERHVWEKERAEREKEKHVKEMELLQVKIDSENKD